MILEETDFKDSPPRPYYRGRVPRVPLKGSFILYLKGRRRMMFQLSGFYFILILNNRVPTRVPLKGPLKGF